MIDQATRDAIIADVVSFTTPLVPVLIAFAIKFLNALANKYHIDVITANQDVWDNALDKSMSYAFQRLTATGQKPTSDEHTALAQSAAYYLLDHFPDILSRAGVKTTTGPNGLKSYTAESLSLVQDAMKARILPMAARHAEQTRNLA